ncbi:hypothetical protein [Accumulibacter sp.]|nr:hypothetical protein [Accumulibacter sp.]
MKSDTSESSDGLNLLDGQPDCSLVLGRSFNGCVGRASLTMRC